MVRAERDLVQRHKRKNSRLIVHLHRFELSAATPTWSHQAIDQVVCVSRHYARLCREQVGWPAEKGGHPIPNYLDVGQLDRPKLDGARHHLGLVGVVPARKRLDLALDVLEELRREDDRYLLFVKSSMPWDHWWVWRKPDEREHFTTALRGSTISAAARGRRVR